MEYVNPQALVGTDWLAENLDVPNVRVIDVSYFLPGANRDPRQEFAAKQLAIFFFRGIDACARIQATRARTWVVDTEDIGACVFTAKELANFFTSHIKARTAFEATPTSVKLALCRCAVNKETAANGQTGYR